MISPAVYWTIICISLIVLAVTALIHLFLLIRISRELNLLFRTLAKTGQSLISSASTINSLADSLQKKIEHGDRVLALFQDAGENFLATARQVRKVIFPLVQQAEQGERGKQTEDTQAQPSATQQAGSR